MATQQETTEDGDGGTEGPVENKRNVKERSVGVGDTPLLLQHLFQSRNKIPSPWNVGIGAGVYLPTGTGIAEAICSPKVLWRAYLSSWQPNCLYTSMCTACSL